MVTASASAKRLLVGLAFAWAVMAPHPAHAADPRDLYLAARADAQAGRHADVVTKLDEVIRLLGSRNHRVLPLLIRALVALREPVRALEELGHYFALQPPPDPALAETAEMAALQTSQKPLAQAQRQAYEKAVAADLAPYEAYLRDHPHGRWADEVRSRLAEQKVRNAEAMDDADWQRVTSRAYVDETSIREALQSYLRHHPSGSHAPEARARIATLNERLRQKRLAAEQAQREQARVARQAEHARLLVLADAAEARAGAHRLLGTLSLAGGLGLTGAGVYVLATDAVGEDASGLLAAGLAGGGVFLLLTTSSQWNKASRENRDAGHLRAQAGQWTVGPMIRPGTIGAVVTWGR